MLLIHIIYLGIKHSKVNLHIIWDHCQLSLAITSVKNLQFFNHSIFFVKHCQFALRILVIFQQMQFHQKNKLTF
jgi:hypothetical protein